MTHFLDTLPLDFGLKATRELQGILAGRYYNEDLIVELLRKTDLSPADVDLSGSARQIWFRVLDTARNQNVLRQVVNTASGEAAVGARIQELLEAQPVIAAPGDPDGGAKTPAENPWMGPAAASGIERLLAKVTTLLDISFLAKAVRVAPAVARLRVSFGMADYHGTAFRVGPRLLLTNHHVLHDWKNGDKKPQAIAVWFDYELDAKGDLKKILELPADPDSIIGDKEHDWAVVRTKEDIPDAYPILQLEAKLPPAKDDRVYIIQHPNGGPKQIGLHRSLVSHVDSDVIQYLTDTENGSSGSPVFNERWEVVGLHHKWVELQENQGDEATVVYRNQGRRIEQVVKGMKKAGLELD
jgi:endonuclease G